MPKINIIAGVDEVGRGCLAGPVVSAAVILNNQIDIKNIRDSKKYLLKKEYFFQIILKKILPFL